MTTRVRIVADSDGFHKVRVVAQMRSADGDWLCQYPVMDIEPGEECSTYVHAHQTLLISELPRDVDG